ncbi:flavodoxin family protein [Mitsuokella multacida]|uniref:flavodoxin family protein n=1 Tax=Mitsuokella multacida TaxID=52226 RepID=UPI003F5DF847
MNRYRKSCIRYLEKEVFMKILLVYSSRTGNTKKVAEAIGEELGFRPCRSKKSPQLPTLTSSSRASGSTAARPMPR